MRTLFDWIRSWFGTSELTRSVALLSRNVDKLRVEKEARERELRVATDEFEKAREVLIKKHEKINSVLRQQKEMYQRLEVAMNTAEETISTLSSITIPGLVATNKLFLERWRAETAVYAMRQAALSPSKELE